MKAMHATFASALVIVASFSAAHADQGAQIFPPENPAECESASLVPGVIGALTWDGVNSVRCQSVVITSETGTVGIGGQASSNSLDVTAPLDENGIASSAALHIYFGDLGNETATGATNMGGNIWMGGFSGDMRGADFVFDGGTDSLFWFTNSGSDIDGATSFLWGGDATHSARHNLYIRNDGYVGLGTTSPKASLHVAAPTVDNNMTGILVEETSSSLSSPRIGFVDTYLGANTAAPVWYIDNLKDNFRIFRQPNINTAGWEALHITNTGNTGIGTATPQAKLDVNGGIKLGPDTTCNAAKAGTLSYSNGHVYVCNGTSLIELAPG